MWPSASSLLHNVSLPKQECMQYKLDSMCAANLLHYCLINYVPCNYLNRMYSYIVQDLVPPLIFNIHTVLGSMEPSGVGGMGQQLEEGCTGSVASLGARSSYLSLMASVAPQYGLVQHRYGSLLEHNAGLL